MAAVDTPVEATFEQEKVFLRWNAPSRPHRGLSKDFLTVPVVIAILVGLILLVAGEWMIIGVVAALVFAYYAWSIVPPELAEYQVTSRGLRVAGRLYLWDEFTRWWIGEKWESRLLCLEAPMQTVGQIMVPLGDVSEEKLEGVMEKLLLHEQPADTQLDKAGKWLSEKFPLEKRAS